jgi:MFS family permease
MLRARPFGGLVRWLLQLDQPVPARSQEAVQAETEANYRWNYAVNLLDGTAFWFGISFASGTTILPLFVSKLTGSPFPLALLAVLAQSGWFLPQLLTANLVEQLPRKKAVAVNLAFFLEPLPMWLLVAAALLAPHAPGMALLVFLVGYAWQRLGSGVVATAYQELIARCFPVDRRGRFVAVQSAVGFGMAALGSLFSAWLLSTFAFPSNFVYTFVIAAVAVALSLFFLGLTREPVSAPEAATQSNRQFWASLPGIFRRDHNYRRFMISRLLMALGSMGTGFAVVAAVDRWRIADSAVGIFTGALFVGQTASDLALGWLADRHGHKLSLEVGSLASLLAFGLAWLAPSPAWYYLVFALLGVTAGSINVSGLLIALEFCEASRRPTYIGLTNTGVGLITVVAPLLGAVMADVGFSGLFAASAAMNLAALALMHLWVQEPRRVRPAI